MVNSEGEAETDDDVAVAGSEVVATGYAHAHIEVAPAATTKNAAPTL